MNEKKENFKRISENRKSKIIELISKLHNLTNTAFYEYSEEDINNLFDPIENALKEERRKFNKMEDVKDLVEEKLIKVFNTKGKYASWTVPKSAEEVVDNLYYICVRNDGEYRFHIIPSYDFSMYIKEYHKSFIEKKGVNGATSTVRSFCDKSSTHVPEKKENEYLDNWIVLE